MKAKILLIRPYTISSDFLAHNLLTSNFFYLPYPLLYLASVLSTEFEVEILDFEVLKLWQKKDRAAVIDEVRQRLFEKLESRPFMVGISCHYMTNAKAVLEIAGLVKAFQPEVHVVAGGVWPTLFSEDILNVSADVDYVIKGEGEYSTLDLARVLRDGGDLSAIDGLTWRSKAGSIISQPKTNYIQNLDLLPLPAYDLIKFDDYRFDDVTAFWNSPKGLMPGIPAPIISSRSCPNRCNFCANHQVMGLGIRMRSAGHVLDEIQWLYEERGIRHFIFFDDNFTHDKKRTLEICHGIINRKLNIQFSAGSGFAANTLDAETLDALSEAGLTWMLIAIESASDFIRNKIMGKNLPREKIFQVVEDLKRHPHIINGAVFIIGMPEDTSQTLMETYELIEELDLDVFDVANAFPYYGTALYRQCLRDGLLLFDPTDWRANNDLFAVSSARGRFYIKPYEMTLDELSEFRLRFDELTERKRSQRHRSVSRGYMRN